MLQIAFTLNCSKLLSIVISFWWKQNNLNPQNKIESAYVDSYESATISSVKCLCSGFKKKSMYLINLWYSLYKAAWQIPKLMIITWKNVYWCKLILLQSFYYLEWGMLLTEGVYLTIDYAWMKLLIVYLWLNCLFYFYWLNYIF